MSIVYTMSIVYIYILLLFNKFENFLLDCTSLCLINAINESQD